MNPQPAPLIKFDRFDKKKWFCVYDSMYIRQYKGEMVAKELIIPMRRYLDNLFSPELVEMIFERFDARSFMFADLMSFALFQSQLKLLKAK